MIQISSLLQQLGILETPLLMCSVLACIIVIDRVIILLRYTSTQQLTSQGLAVIESNRKQSKSMRTEVASLWLVQQKQKLLSGLRLLNLVVLISPLLGLLGTVLGLIGSFSTIAQQNGPVEVSMLAEGLGVAMSTTAVGLMIAVPSLVLLHLYYLWIDKLVGCAEASMNKSNLSLLSADTIPS